MRQARMDHDSHVYQEKYTRSLEAIELKEAQEKKRREMRRKKLTEDETEVSRNQD